MWCAQCCCVVLFEAGDGVGRILHWHLVFLPEGAAILGEWPAGPGGVICGGQLCVTVCVST